jgi:hypothetical protein
MILSVFGGLWVVFAILAQSSPAPILCVFPIAIAAMIAGWSISVARKSAPRAPDDQKRINRIAMYSSIFEGVAIFVGINVLQNLGIADQYLPFIAVIVGLHFLPFARYVPDRRYYPMALLLVIIGVIGSIVRSTDLRAGFVGLSSAIVLWAAAVVALRTNSPNA